MLAHQPSPPTARSKPAAPSSRGEPGVLCSMLPRAAAAHLKLQEPSGNLLDHLRSCILSCTMLYLTHFLYIWSEFTKPFIKNKWQYDAVQNAVCKSTLFTHTTLVLCIYIHTHVNPHTTYTCTSLLHETPIMSRAKLTSPSPYSTNIYHLDIHASTVRVILTALLNFSPHSLYQI